MALEGELVIIRQQTCISDSFVKKTAPAQTLTSDSWIVKAVPTLMTSQSDVKVTGISNIPNSSSSPKQATQTAINSSSSVKTVDSLLYEANMDSADETLRKNKYTNMPILTPEQAKEKVRTEGKRIDIIECRSDLLQKMIPRLDYQLEREKKSKTANKQTDQSAKIILQILSELRKDYIVFGVIKKAPDRVEGTMDVRMMDALRKVKEYRKLKAEGKGPDPSRVRDGSIIETESILPPGGLMPERENGNVRRWHFTKVEIDAMDKKAPQEPSLEAGPK